MNKRYGSILIVSVTILVLCFAGTASATNWSVDSSGGADFTGIQDAINNAKDGDTIIVHSGVYYENVVVTKSLTLMGNGQPVIDADGEGNAITLTAEGITLVGFNATNAGSLWNDAGIAVISNNNTITGSNASNNSYNGICLYDFCNNNTITGNNVSSNNRSGISLYFSSNNTITGNNVSNNEAGISLSCFSNNNTITGNNVSNNRAGIHLGESSNNTITGNNVSNNRDGIGLHASSNNNTIKGNNASSNNRYGILIHASSNNTITGNNVSNNSIGGIGLIGGISSLIDSSNNKIYFNNFINNTDNVDSYASTNIWNSPLEITYTYSGSTYKSYLGNYWDDYEGTDADKDGIGDEPYSINGDRDNYPLMELCEKYFALPMPGKWRGSAEFGEFVFIVNNNSTGISKISYNFSNWTCGPTTRSGGVSISHTHWPITSGQFTIETDLGGTLPMTIRGKFDENGTHASGNWEAVSSGVTCSGAWDADYNSNEKSNT